MGFFDFFSDAISGVTSVASSVVDSSVGQLALAGIGTAFGDPGLGAQAREALGTARSFERMLGIGAPAGGAPARRPPLRAVGAPAGYASAPTIRAAPRYPYTIAGRRVYVTKPALLALVRRHRPAQPPPFVLDTPPPRPPPAPAPILATTSDVRALLSADPAAVQAAAAAGQPIVIGGKTIDPGTAIVLPPSMASVAADLAASTGLNVTTKNDPTPEPDWNWRESVA